jgi:hypothetical protein
MFVWAYVVIWRQCKDTIDVGQAVAPLFYFACMDICALACIAAGLAGLGGGKIL